MYLMTQYVSAVSYLYETTDFDGNGTPESESILIFVKVIPDKLAICFYLKEWRVVFPKYFWNIFWAMSLLKRNFFNNIRPLSESRKLVA